MILFGERLKNLRETVIEYLMNRIDEKGSILLDEGCKVFKKGTGYFVGHPKLEAVAEELDNIDLEDLCQLADDVHTLPAKDLKI